MTSHSLALLALLALAVPARAAPFFEKHIRPLLAARCVFCHGSEGKAKGGLNLETVAGIRQGGDSGPVVVPGKPEQSLLIQAVMYTTDRKMPPKSKLPPSEVALLRKWVQSGAELPEGKAETGTIKRSWDGPITSTHWAFQPMRRVVPPVADASGSCVHNPIDAFLRAKLQAKGLRPAPPADRRTLIRRATFDLTGLPPTPEEIDAFLKDDSPDAFARVVDRLLASPAYGERWGRHWLDVARYADSNGMDENLVQANAWRYRDYIITSFNADKPYDQFVIEQLAGDLLARPTPDQLIATGFLALGPKMLAEDDPVKMQMDIVDEQIDTVGKTFLGLTLGCARCHDHKFDPIPTADYYSLAGIFKSTKVMDNYKVVARWYERPVGTPAELERWQAQRDKVERAKQAIAQRISAANERLLAEARSQLPRYIEAGQELLRRRAALRNLMSLMDEKVAGTIVVEAENFASGNVKKDLTHYGKSIGVIYNAGPLPNVAEYEVNVPKAGTYQLELRFAAAQSRPVELTINGELVKSGAAATVTGTWFPDSQKWTVEGVFTLKAGKNRIGLSREGPFPHFDKLAFIPKALPQDVVALVPTTPEQLALKRKLNPAFLQQTADYLAKTPTADPRAIPFVLPKHPERFYPAPTQAELKKQRDTLAALEKATPPLPEAMGATEGTVANVRIHLRGNHLTLGPEVPRRFPRVLAGEKQLPLGKQSGRKELALWLTRPQHPLTARVLVNRIWHWHFGAGLVRSPDNFGVLGDQPTHPELLDWLALQFVENGWSIKSLHRLIMLSATYQMSATYDATAARTDPDNRLLWRWDRQRLDAESLRDALLAIGGTLDRSMGGSLMQGSNRGYVPGYPNSTYDRYDFPRRSVYLPVVRSMLYDVFQAFDFADPSMQSGKRDTTTIAPQALFALNGKLMAEQSRSFASHLLDAPIADDTDRVARAYVYAFGRPPTKAETRRALDFLQRLQAE